ncbi:hypothetical protein ABW19_dt0209098 [Dactylella cylindrospora]|nr:hypothetical protein ABW19_dt0209098 [Dactylella cylindrospora]
MDINSLLSPTTTPTPGTGSPTNSTPVSGNPSSPHPFSGTTSHRNSLTRRESQPQMLLQQTQSSSSSTSYPVAAAASGSYPPPILQHPHAPHPHPSSSSSSPQPAHYTNNNHFQYHHHQPQPQPQIQQHHHHQYPSHHHSSSVPPQSHPTIHPSHQQHQQPLHHPQSQAVQQRPSIENIRSHSLPARKSQSPSYFSPYPDARRESLPIVHEQQAVPPVPARHHSLTHLENPTFAPSPLSTSQVPTPQPLTTQTNQAPPPPPPPASQNRIPSFSSERGPISRSASNASQIMEEERARNEQESVARRVSQTKSTSSMEAPAPPREPSPSPKDAPPELFSDDEDEDMEIDEDDESTKELGLPEVERLGELIQKLDRAYLKDEVDAEDTPPTYSDFLECIALLRRGFVASKFDPNYEFKERLNEERERMLKIYPLSEEMWTQWLHDLSVDANDLNAKVTVMELWSKSVAHESGSVTLWKGYIKFILRTWREAAERAKADGGDPESWSEIFTFDLVNSVLLKGVGETMYNIPRVS